MNANETDALFWRTLLVKYMSRVYDANRNASSEQGETFVAYTKHGLKTTDEEDTVLATIEGEVLHWFNL